MRCLWEWKVLPDPLTCLPWPKPVLRFAPCNCFQFPGLPPGYLQLTLRGGQGSGQLHTVTAGLGLGEPRPSAIPIGPNENDKWEHWGKLPPIQDSRFSCKKGMKGSGKTFFNYLKLTLAFFNWDVISGLETNYPHERKRSPLNRCCREIFVLYCLRLLMVCEKLLGCLGRWLIYHFSAEPLNSGISQGIGLDTLRKVPSNVSHSEKMKEEGKKAEAREK